MTRNRRVVTGTMVALLASVGAADAQERGRIGGMVDVSFSAASAVGDMALLVDDGFGLSVGMSGPMTENGVLRFRGDLGFLAYGHERQWYCFSFSCRVGSDLTTTNSILYAGAGPELAIPMGPIQPYVRATAGVSYFVTTSQLEDAYGAPDYFETTNYDDAVFAWRAGAGMRMRLGRPNKPIYFDFGVEQHFNGVADFLTQGDIVDNADGSITVFPNRSEANMVNFRFGMSFAIGGPDRPKDKY